MHKILLSLFLGISQAAIASVFPSSVILRQSFQQQLIVAQPYATETPDFVWSSSDNKIVSVDRNGLVTGGSNEGVALIIASDGEQSFSTVVSNVGNRPFFYYDLPLVDKNPIIKFRNTVTGQWEAPAEAFQNATDFGGTWIRIPLPRIFIDLPDLYQMYLETEANIVGPISFNDLTRPQHFFNGAGQQVLAPEPSFTIQGTQVQLKGGDAYLRTGQSLNGRLFYPGQSVKIEASEPPTGTIFVRWEGDSKQFLLDSLSSDTTLLVPDKGSATLFAVFEEAEDPYADARNTYAMQCALCHGANGGGIPSLIGIQERYSLAEIVGIIDQRMPPQNPTSCTGSCAEELGEFVYNQIFEKNTSACGSDQSQSIPLKRNLRLLTSIEYLNTVKDIFQLSADFNLDDLLPEDFIVNGYRTDRDGSVSSQRLVAFANAADAVINEIGPLEDLIQSCQNNTRCLVETISLRILRRPASQQELNYFLGILNRSGEKSLIRVLLNSPSFLYRSEMGTPDPNDGDRYRLSDFEIATLLSFTYLGKAPNMDLLQRAQNGQVQTPQQIAQIAREMLNQNEAREKLKGFIVGWLGLEKEISGDVDQAFKNDLVEEVTRFAIYKIFENNARFSDLFMSSETFVNQRLAQHYGIAGVNDWQKVTYPEADRVGIIGKAHFFASNAITTSSHPVKRGLFIRRNLLCQEFPPPPVGAELKPISDPTLTTRERFEIAHRQEDCMSCHQFVDSVGFGLEMYDQLGLIREFERVPSGDLKPINADGGINSLDTAETILSAESPWLDFMGAKSLSELIVESPNGKACFARQYLRFTLGSSIEPEDNCTLQSYAQSFKSDDIPIKELLIQFTQTATFTYRR